MAITNASTLAEYASGISTQGATLTVDANNKRVGIGTTNPQAMLQVGTGVTVFGNAGIASFTSLKLSGDTDSTSVSTGALTVTGGVGIGLSLTVGGDVSVGGTITYEDVTNVDSLGIVTARSGVRIVGGGVTCVGVATFFSAIDANSTLDVAGDVSIADKIIHTGDTNTAIRFPSADTITAETGGTERFRITSDGKYYFTGTGAGSGARGLEIDTESVGAADEGVILNARASGSTGRIKFQTNSTTAMTILGGGDRIGIGTDAPYANGILHCDGNIVLTSSGNAPKIIFDEYSSGTDPKAQIAMDQTDSTNASLMFYTEDSGTLSERVRITSGGQVNIGGNYTQTTNQLQVAGAIQCLNKLESTTGNDLLLNAGSANRDVKIQVNDVNMMYVKGSTGNVGINTTSPVALLHVAHSGTSTGTGTNICASLRSGASGRDQCIQFADGTTSAYVGMLGGDIYVADSGSTERLRILSGGGITFGGETTADHALDDYEEGSWTPTFSDLGNYSAYAVWRFTKIGNLVQFGGRFVCTTTTNSGSDSVSIDLPFASDGNITNSLNNAVGVAMTYNINTNGQGIVGYVPAGQSTCSFYKTQDDGVWDNLTTDDVSVDDHIIFSMTYKAA